MRERSPRAYHDRETVVVRLLQRRAGRTLNCIGDQVVMTPMFHGLETGGGGHLGRPRDGHATVLFEERHLADTWFAWMGGLGEDDVFYGCDLLRQHHARFDHARPDHHHAPQPASDSIARTS